MRARVIRWEIAVVAVILATLAGWTLYERITGTSPIIHFGGVAWIPISADSPLISPSIALALGDPPPVRAGPIVWRELDRGFEATELPVLAADGEVDRIFLARIDPSRFRFVVRIDRSGRNDLRRWMVDSGAVLVINGSYYSRSGGPSTPVVAEGSPAGPSEYKAQHGAFVAKDAMATIVDLASVDWRDALRDAENAFVSYPLLIGNDGSPRVAKDENWLANRSFIAQDRSSNIVVGTTKDAFFSLRRLAEFLVAAPLDLTLALNLDGGPVACQGIKTMDFRREECGRWEVQVRDGEAKMLPPLSVVANSPMPLALLVYGK